MKTLSKILFFVLFAGSLTIYMTSCDKSDPILESVTNVNFEKSDREDLVSEEEIDKFIVDWISTHRTTFDWDNAPDEMLYSALMHGDSILTIGFKVGASTDKREFYRQNRTLPSDWREERQSIIDYILSEERSYRNNERITVRNLLPFPLDNRLAVINIKVTNPSTISNLRDRYHIKLDPPGYLPLSFRRGGAEPPTTGSPEQGCFPDPVLINSDDYNQDESSNTWISWNYSNHRIPDAWTCTKGEDIEVCVIDTGVSDDQPFLSASQFDPYGSGRTILKHVDLPNLEGNCLTGNEDPFTWYCPTYPQNDECGHGTGVAGIIGYPAIPFSAAGIAHNSNLFTIKATHDVLLNATDELVGVTNAIMTAANRQQTKIISMSIGRVSPNPNMVDALMTAHGNDKMIFAAAGTFFFQVPFVVFPASSPYTFAVAGENTDGEACSICNFGSLVNFTAIIERQTTEGPLTLASSSGMKYSGGSSGATATVAGITALVWSKYPTEDRMSIYERLKKASSNYDPNAPYQGESATKGWGYIDAYAAVEECN